MFNRGHYLQRVSLILSISLGVICSLRGITFAMESEEDIPSSQLISGVNRTSSCLEVETPDFPLAKRLRSELSSKQGATLNILQDEEERIKYLHDVVANRHIMSAVDLSYFLDDFLACGKICEKQGRIKNAIIFYSTIIEIYVNANSGTINDFCRTVNEGYKSVSAI